MKVGVIGAGFWGKKHVEEYTALGMQTVVADIQEENLRLCREKFGSETTTDYKQILDDKDIRHISICTPNSTHYKICKEALESGKHVLVEKPITLTHEKAVELARLAEVRKLSLAVGHIFRFNNAIKKVKEIVRSGDLGEIFYTNFQWTNLEPVWTDRDVIFDLGSHPLDIVLYVFEKNPKKVFCNGAGFRQENPETAVINYNLENVFVNMELSWVTPVKTRMMRIVGSRKSLEIDCVNQKIKFVDNSTREVSDIPIERNNTLQDELSHFLEASKNGLYLANDAKSACDVIRLLEFAKNSLHQKKIINIVSAE